MRLAENTAMNRKITVMTLLVVAVAIVVAVAASDWSWDLAALEGWAQEHPVVGGIALVAIFILSTLVPITSLPLLPLAARAYGVPMTCALSILGWWLGCIIAFEFARWGRPHLERLASKKMLARCETLLSQRPTFTTMVILRMLFPGDFFALALGLMREVRFSTFALAAFIGTIPSGVIASYAGGEFGRGRYWTAIIVIAAMFLGIIVVRRMWEARTAPATAKATAALAQKPASR